MANKKRRPNRDHVRLHHRPSPPSELIEERMRSLVSPAVFAQEAYYRSLGMRDRILNLPVMVAATLMLLFREFCSVRELARSLATEPLFWQPAPLKVSQQALSKRLLEFPAELFQRVYTELLPHLQDRAQQRSRPIPKVLVDARQHFGRILALDCSTLEALFRKMDALRELPVGKLAGKIAALVDVERRLPEQIIFHKDAKDSDFSFLEEVLEYIQSLNSCQALMGRLAEARGALEAGVLLLFDRGFHDYTFYDRLVGAGCAWVSRPKSNDSIHTQKALCARDGIYESLIRIGSPASENGQAEHLFRLVEVKHGSSTYRYITSVLDPHVLSAEQIAELYGHRWRIEEAFFLVKRLLHLSYLWTGSVNGIQLQLWATLLYYAVLVDLSDEIAEQLQVPFLRISLEMVHRGLYYFIQASSRGETTDPVQFLAEHHRLYAIVKALDKRQTLPEFASPRAP